LASRGQVRAAIFKRLARLLKSSMADPRAVRCLFAAIWIAGIFGAPALAAGPGADADRRLAFDIPEQPLVSALNAYGAVTQLSVFYDGALAVGRRSTAVKGVFAPQEALRRLLQGAAFVAEGIESGTVSIRIEAETPAEQLAAVKKRSAGFASYLGLIQASVRNALCRTPTTQPGAGDLLVRFWIDSSGRVARAELLTSTGQAAEDVADATALQAIEIGQPPPAQMPQPVTMMILPRNSGAAGCDAATRRANIH
jgi:TonB family protein